MKRRLGLVLLGVLAGCRSPQPAATSFRGLWLDTSENGITGGLTRETTTVIAQGPMFKTLVRSTDSETVEIYDGTTLYRQFVVFPNATNAFISGATAEAAGAAVDTSSSPVTAQVLSPDKLSNLRFWQRPAKGSSSDGGAVAGQQTRLYKLRSLEPDGEHRLERWIDAKTGIVLRSVEAVYSSQANTFLTRQTRECQEIRYGPVDPTVFSKP